MADESQAIRGISWRETFPFTQIFRSFRIAIHPSKLVLGLAALIVLYLGGMFLDAIWPTAHRAVPGESLRFEYTLRHKTGTFKTDRADARRSLEARYAAMLMQYEVAKNPEEAAVAAEKGNRLTELKAAIIKRRDNTDLINTKKSYDVELAAAKAVKEEPLRTDSIHAVESGYRAEVARVYDTAYANLRSARQIRNSGIFAEFFAYEISQFNTILDSVREFSWKPGYHAMVNFLTIGPVWLLSQHPVYFFLFLILFTATWAIFGGAIARIAAVHVARDEKLSLRAALRFSTGKFLSFLFAPIIPLLIVAALGVVITIGALVINLPFLGPIVAGLLFFLVLAIGFVMTLVLVGTIGGFNLMYPTIAVEGSDSFDAISRSFSYLYARPWRLAFYTLVALIYGAITYMFLKLFITLMLTLVHSFVGFGVFRNADNGRPLWDMLWPGPGEWGRLSYDIQTLTLGGGETAGAYLIALWVYLVIAILGAFAISFYFSSNTIIYYLMRNEVDATDMDDVFVEQQDDDLLEADPAATTPVTTPAPVTPVAAAPQPASTPAGDPNTTPDVPPSDTPPAT